MQHILIVGQNGVGKSTLVQSLLSAISLPVYGVITKKEAAGPDGFCPVYIRLLNEPKRFSDENRIGMCKEGKSIAFPEAFDRFAVRMEFPHDGVIVLDELGFLESDAHVFTESVLRILDEAPFVIAAVRDKHTPFLDAVRSHPRACVRFIDKDNRDALLRQLLNELTAAFAEASDHS